MNQTSKEPRELELLSQVINSGDTETKYTTEDINAFMEIWQPIFRNKATLQLAISAVKSWSESASVVELCDDLLLELERRK